MPIGTYGWSTDVDLFQQHIVFLERPIPVTNNYGLLNLGDGSFDGLSAGCFHGFGNNTVIAVNVRAGTTYHLFDAQVDGSNVFIIDSNGSTFSFLDPATTSGQGLLNIGSQFYSGTGQFSGSSSGTYLAISAPNGFGGNLVDFQVGGGSKFSIDTSGDVFAAGSFQVDANPVPSATAARFFGGGQPFTGSSGGTVYAAGCTSAFTGNLADWQVNGVSQFAVNAAGTLTRYAGSTPSNGQLLIGNTTNGNFSLATLTAGSNITITNGAGTITIAASGSSFTWATKTANYTITTSDSGILADATSAALTITLPTAVGATQQYTVKKKDSSTNTVTVATTSSQTIDGATTYVLYGQNQAISVASDNANWFVV